jgi:prophage regulatory protein
MEDRIIDANELRKFTPYSPVQVWRLEKAGKFPRRIKLSGGSRVGWSLNEILEHNENLKAARDAAAASPEAA